MDTRFWGPDGWRLLHSIAVGYPENPSKEQQDAYRLFFTSLKYVLPCIYCRRSYTEYIHELPIEPHLDSPKALSKWLYKLHNMVNDKLRKQGLNPNPDPSFDSIWKRYVNYVHEINASNCVGMPGWDFMYCILFNYPKMAHEMELIRRVQYVVFVTYLAKVLPFSTSRQLMEQYLSKHPVQQALTSRRELTRWGHLLEFQVANTIHCNCASYEQRSEFIESYRAGCGGKKDKKKTCRLGNSPKPLGKS